MCHAAKPNRFSMSHRVNTVGWLTVPEGMRKAVSKELEQQEWAVSKELEQ